jgi:flavin-dependent dehydrogenase
MTAIRIVGGGPAGSAAAIAALEGAAAVEVLEKSRVPHHKVCGEFLAAETCRVLEEIGVWAGIRSLKPARIERCRLRLGSRVKEWKLPEPAFGLSRRELDQLLLDRAAGLGAKVVRGERWQASGGSATIFAIGRRGGAPKGARLFAFKSHFEGPADDAVEVFFGRSGYIGISPVENRVTNICGIMPESVLRRYQFRFDDMLSSRRDLAERVRGLTRRMPWLATGPLVFSDISPGESTDCFTAGDSAGFVDPFTGSGILNALLTGRLAGDAASRGQTANDYLSACRKMLHRPFAVSAAFRAILRCGLAEYLAPFVPGRWLYSLTRV